VLARTCALILTSATVRWPRSPSLCIFFFNIDTRTLRYIYFLRLTPSDTRNDRYDNLQRFKREKKQTVKQRIAREISRMKCYNVRKAASGEIFMKKEIGLSWDDNDYVTMDIAAASIGGSSCALFPLAWIFTFFVFIRRNDARSLRPCSRSQNLGFVVPEFERHLTLEGEAKKRSVCDRRSRSLAQSVHSERLTLCNRIEKILFQRNGRSGRA